MFCLGYLVQLVLCCLSFVRPSQKAGPGTMQPCSRGGPDASLDQIVDSSLAWFPCRASLRSFFFNLEFNSIQCTLCDISLTLMSSS